MRRYGRLGVRVNAVNPGTINTPLVRGLLASRGQDLGAAATPCVRRRRRRSSSSCCCAAARAPLARLMRARQYIRYPAGRIGDVSEVAEAVMFLADDSRAGFVGAPPRDARARPAPHAHPTPPRRSRGRTWRSTAGSRPWARGLHMREPACYAQSTNVHYCTRAHARTNCVAPRAREANVGAHGSTSLRVRYVYDIYRALFCAAAP